MAVDWTQLPPELVETISKSLTIYADYLNIRAVCRTWQSSIPKHPNHLTPQLPWLMFAHSKSNQPHRAFFNLSANKFHFLNLPEASHRKRHCGSSNGWLIILEDYPLFLLINPLTRAKFSLPPLSSFPNVVSFNYSDIGREYAIQNSLGHRLTRSLRQMRDWFIKKVVMSCSPLKESNFVAMAINETGDLAYCKRGDQSWTIISNARLFCEDVVCFNGLFYAVNKAGQIAVCDVSDDLPKVSFIETPSQFGGDMFYLVSSEDELLLITRPMWVRLRSLGDQMFFIGENASLSLSATDFSGCMGNCIYYTDDYSDTNYDGHFGEYDLGIFKLCDGSFKPLPCYTRNFHSRSRWPPPIWVSPNLC